MFSNLQINHDLSFNPGGKILYRFGKDGVHGFEGITYYNVPNTIEFKIKDMIPELNIPEFGVSLMVINRAEIPAHIDNGILTSINFYIETADAVTRYHKVKDDYNPVIVKLPNQTNGALFEPECLDTIGEFHAKPGEVWALDVTIPHSVSCAKQGVRIAYVLQSREISYAETMRRLGR